jgi:hypothetical protein
MKQGTTMNQQLLYLFSLVQQKSTGPSDITTTTTPPPKKKDKRHNTVASKRLNPRKDPVSFSSASYST